MTMTGWTARTSGMARHWRRVALVGAAATLLFAGVACGGGSAKRTPAAETPTQAAAAAPVDTPAPQNAGLKTPIAISPGELLTQEDLAARGTGTPGRGAFTGSRLLIPSIGVDAPFSNKVVGTDGQMPNPDGPEDVAYYDFSQWPTAGGLPGKGGNVVLAGHVDYIRYGPAVFWRLQELSAGDVVTIRMQDGTEASYKIEFNKRITVGDADWSNIVNATAEESITLITCAGQFEAGRYTDRTIVWGRRV